jgi:lipoyl(octanoyl) transferase
MVHPVDLGVVPHKKVWRLQEELVAALATGTGSETLLLVEHPPVYTIGSGGSMDNVLSPGATPIRVNRGGDVTYHGPGQLVGYPLLDLGRRGRDLHRYLRFLEEVLLTVVDRFGISARRHAGQTGIWTDKGKLAAIGVGVRRWVTMHGFALNVTIDTGPFALINPCGFPGCSITTMHRELDKPIAIADVKKAVVEDFIRLLPLWLPAGRSDDDVLT